LLFIYYVDEIKQINKLGHRSNFLTTGAPAIDMSDKTKQLKKTNKTHNIN